MAGNIFSGHYGRRCPGPYLDEVPRVFAVEAAGLSFEHKSCSLFVPFDGSVHHVAVMQVRVGAIDQYRFICEQCGRRCRVLYLSTVPGCRRCTGARYRSQSESSATRLQRRAYKILKAAKLDPINAQLKIRGRHWTTHWRVLLSAERAIEIIVERNEQIMSWLRRSRSATGLPKA
jgi:hypothetical protein